jgi:hypothetical protein
MIFLLAAVLLLCAGRCVYLARRRGLLMVVKSVAAAAVLGLLAGVFIGLGARLGMSAITIANGDALRLTLAGTSTVVFTFSSAGIFLGVVYEVLFRQPLRRHGAAYGGLIALVTWYPLAHAAAQQLTGAPALFPFLIISGMLVALMWLPFGVALEALLRRWLRGGEAPLAAGTAA